MIMEDHYKDHYFQPGKLYRFTEDFCLAHWGGLLEYKKGNIVLYVDKLETQENTYHRLLNPNGILTNIRIDWTTKLIGSIELINV